MTKELEAIVAEMRAACDAVYDDTLYVQAGRVEGWANRLEAGEGWRDIATAPKDGTWIIGACFSGATCHYLGRVRKTDAKQKHWSDGCYCFDCTHWQPIAPPTDSRGAE
jgi:hypothetical protein